VYAVTFDDYMTVYLVVPLLVVVAVIQATVMPHVALWGVFPDLPLLIVVSWTLLRGAREGMVWGFIAGMAVDLFSGAPFGAATLSLIAVGFLSGFGEATVFRTHIALPLVTMFLATIVYDLIFLLVIQISGRTVSWLDSLFRVVLPSAVLNALLTPVVFGAMRLLRTRLGREEMEW
jgi:rod shape-determining protein MreD